jgi:DNA-binding LytR/AlgR family response regulator
MTGLRVLILEDEPPARERLEQALARSGVAIVVEAALASVAQAVAWLGAHPAPDLILADIQLADGLSLEIFDRVALTCPVIFCTAFDEYLTGAMARGGIDYLLKPIRDDDLARALGKYRRLEAHFAARLQAGVAALGQALRPRRRLVVRRAGGFASVAIDEVAYFVVDDKLVDVVTRDGRRFGADQTLGELEQLLPAGAFFRINRQYLVRAEAITGFRPFVKGRICVELTPPTRDDVVVSQENAGRFRAWLGG